MKATIDANSSPTLANFFGYAAAADRTDSSDIRSMICDDYADCKAEQVRLCVRVTGHAS